MKKLWYGVLPLLLVTFALRIYRLPQLSLRGDEAATVFEAGVEWEELLRALSKPGPHQPLYHLALHGWMKLAGDGELAVRYLTLISGVLLVPLIYVLGRCLFPGELGRAALWTLLLAAINPMLIWDAQDNRMYPLLAVFNLASFYFSLAILQQRGGWRAWLSYVVSAALALYTHYLAFFVLLTENVLWGILVWRFPHRLQRISRWIAAQMAVAALFVPWFLKAMPRVTRYTTDFLPPVSRGELLRRTLVGLSLGLSVDAQSGTILGLGFLGIAVLGLLTLSRREREEGSLTSNGLTEAQSLLVLLTYLVVPIACIALFSSLRFPIFDERYIMLSLPPYLLILGRGLSNLSRPGLRRWMAAIGLVWILVASGYSLRNYYFIARYMKGTDWRSYVARLLECAQPGDVLIQNYPDPGLTYHLRGRIPRVLLPTGYAVDVQATETKLRRLIETRSRIWLQPQRYAEWDSEGLVEAWLDRHALKVGEERFGNVRLALYLPPRTFQQMIWPVRAVLGDQVWLLGYTLEREGDVQNRRLSDPLQFLETLSLRPGDRLYLTLFWQPQVRLRDNYTVFVHLYDGSMRIWAQKDSLPVEGTYPTRQWQVGEIIVDRYALTLPQDTPAGTYRLGVGIYLLETGARLSVRQGEVCDPESTVWLKDMQVAP